MERSVYANVNAVTAVNDVILSTLTGLLFRLLDREVYDNLDLTATLQDNIIFMSEVFLFRPQCSKIQLDVYYSFYS